MLPHVVGAVVVGLIGCFFIFIWFVASDIVVRGTEMFFESKRKKAAEEGMTLLYDMKRGAAIRYGDVDLTFDHIDGMYSVCYAADRSVVHLSAVTPLREENGSWIVQEDRDEQSRE